MRKILIFLILILSIIILTLYKIEKNIEYRKNTYTSQLEEVFTIKSGESSKTIINNLYNANLIDSKISVIYIIKKNDIGLYAGDFGLSQSMSDKEVVEIISKPASNIDTSRQFLITEGSTLDTIANDLSKFTTFDDSAEQILDFWSDEETLSYVIENYEFISNEILNKDIIYPLEGYFYPATYNISDDATIEQITKLFLDTMEQNLQEYTITNSDYSVHELLTLASIVERETLLVEDKPIVASALYNRLDEGMPLQVDITILYGQQEHKERVLYEDLEYDSPYNTYMYEGLTPGPISTVSTSSIEAVLYPDDTDYIYFFADQNTGKLYFSNTIEEHEQIASDNAWEFSN